MLKNYLQFINESSEYLDVDNLSYEILYDLDKAGLEIDDFTGGLKAKSDQDVKLTNSLMSDGKIIVDLTNIKSDELYLNINYVQFTTLVGLPKKVRKFTAYENAFGNLIGGPDEVSHYLVGNNNLLTSLEGAPSNCSFLTVSRAAIPNCKGLEHGIYEEIELIDNEKLTSLEGLPSDVHLLIIKNCPNLKTLEHIGDVYNLSLKNCPINTFYHIRHLKSDIFNEDEIYKILVPSIEIEYFKNINEEKRQEDYWHNLFIYAKKSKPSELGKIQFPEDFILNLTEEDKNILKSISTLNKFKL